MMVALEARYPCNPCGYRLKLVMPAKAVIRKRSVRMTAYFGALVSPCPECLTVTPPPVKPDYQIDAESAAQVLAYRLRRWPELALEKEAQIV